MATRSEAWVDRVVDALDGALEPTHAASSTARAVIALELAKLIDDIDIGHYGVESYMASEVDE